MRIMEMISGTQVNGAAVNCLEIIRALRAARPSRHPGLPSRLVDLRGDWRRRCRSHRIGLAPLANGPVESDCSGDPQPTDSGRAYAYEFSQFFWCLVATALWRPRVCGHAHNRYLQLHWMFNDRVIAVSEATRRFHQRYNLVSPSRIDVVYNFINDARFHRVTREQGLQVRAELGVDADRRLIGVIGDVIPRKGLLHLIRALPRILQTIPDAHVLSVGHAREAYATECQAEAERLQVAARITWAGVRNDIDRILAGLDVYALPSLEENMPLAILEAMASGRPVVATAVGGVPECVAQEQTGLLVPPGQECAVGRGIDPFARGRRAA